MIDVVSVRINADGDYFRPQILEKLGSDHIRCAMCAIDNDSHTRQVKTGNGLQVFSVLVGSLPMTNKLSYFVAYKSL